MTIVDEPRRSGLVARVQGILLRPTTEWDIIAAEPATIQGLFTGYACILAAIPPVALVIQHLVFVHWLLIPIIVIAVISYVASLIGVFILGFIIDALASSFGAEKNPVQAMKLAVYSYTAGWVAGILNIVPILGLLAILAALYGLYLLYLGLPKLMKSPPEKTAGYFVVSILAAIAVNVVIGMVIASLTIMLTAGAIVSGATAIGSLAGHDARLARMEAASAQLSAATAGLAAQQATAQAASGAPAVKTVDPGVLKTFLPDTVAGLPRTEVSAQTAAAGGFGAANAEGIYSKGDSRITLTVTDLSAMGAMARMASAMGVQSDRETASGYEKVGNVNGRMTTEEWNRDSRSGKYGVLVANRFMIQAEGSGTSIDELKAAVAAVGPDRFEGMAKG
ncbi:MAG TPA: Yip1 family protein [Caulobacteraceae bacterium]|nr:Yip1 family protein [Caulobacteraceae bacterium]